MEQVNEETFTKLFLAVAKDEEIEVISHDSIRKKLYFYKQNMGYGLLLEKLPLGEDTNSLELAHWREYTTTGVISKVSSKDHCHYHINMSDEEVKKTLAKNEVATSWVRSLVKDLKKEQLLEKKCSVYTKIYRGFKDSYTLAKGSYYYDYNCWGLVTDGIIDDVKDTTGKDFQFYDNIESTCYGTWIICPKEKEVKVKDASFVMTVGIQNGSLKKINFYTESLKATMLKKLELTKKIPVEFFLNNQLYYNVNPKQQITVEEPAAQKSKNLVLGKKEGVA